MSITYDHRPSTPFAPHFKAWRETALALLVPPVEVWRLTGWSREFWLNLAMTLTGYFPAIMHALFISQREAASRA